MGVKGLSTPIIRDSATAKNANIKKLLEKDATKNIIGIDMSILIVKALLGSPNSVSLYHSDPKQPLPEVTDKVVSSVKMYISEGYKAVCVFDGTTHKLKAERAHVERYEKDQDMIMELENLYNIRIFDDEVSLRGSIDRVNTIRKKLCRTRADMIYDIKCELEKKFGEKVVCVCAPYEADHQLAALFRQNIIDYVHTIDSDLICLGADMIIDTTVAGDCWYMDVQTFLEKRLAKHYNTGNKRWTLNVLAHVTCILGNDYIKKVPGAGKKKVIEFMKEVVSNDGELANDAVLYNHIRDNIIDKPTHVSAIDKTMWKSDEHKKKHIKLWMESVSMFLYGPVFLVEPSLSGMSPREAMFVGDYTIKFGSMNGEVMTWELASPTEVEIQYSRKLLVGFDALECLVDKIDKFRNIDETIDDMFKACFKMIRWCKTGELLQPLKAPTDHKNNELHFGSILHFDRVPIEYHSKDMLEFWLACRGVKIPDRTSDIINLSKLIHEKVGEMIQPIPKAQMRGVSGWVTPEVLQMKDGLAEIQWQTNDELITLLLRSFPSLSDTSFTSIFGKRNGSRLRVLKHVQGGSFDLNSIKATTNMMSKLDDDGRSLLVVEAPCAPSQKLKEDGKEAFHYVRLCFELNDQGKCVRVLNHPAATCACPVGCIWCAHKGSLLVLCHAIISYSTRWLDDNGTRPSFESIVSQFPRPVNELVSTPIPVDAIYPEPTSVDKKAQNEWKRMRRLRKKKKKGRKGRKGAEAPNPEDELLGEAQVQEDIQNILDEEEDRDADVEIELGLSDNLRDLRDFAMDDTHDMESQAIPGIGDNSVTPAIKVIEKLETWVDAIPDGRDHTGREMQTVDSINQKITRMADHKSSPLYLATQIRRCERVKACLERQAKRNEIKRREIRKAKEQKRINTIESQDSSESEGSDCDQSLIEDESELKDRDLLKAIEPGMNRMKDDLDGKYDVNDIQLNRLVPFKDNNL